MSTAPVATPVSGSEVTVVVIEHDHGTDTAVYATPDGARQHLREYVTAWWEHEMGEPAPNPVTDDDVAHYFENVDGEWGFTETTTVSTSATISVPSVQHEAPSTPEAPAVADGDGFPCGPSGLPLRLSFTPGAIREHFDGDEDYAHVETMTDHDLAAVGEAALTDDSLYRVFHESLVDALNTKAPR